MPRHLKIVGSLALLWSLLAAANHLLLVSENPWYTSQFAEEQLAHGRAYPLWLDLAWAVAAWGGVVGCVLLLARRRMAVPALLLSLIGWVVWALGLDVARDPQLAVPLVMPLAALLYARALVRGGILR